MVLIILLIDYGIQSIVVFNELTVIKEECFDMNNFNFSRHVLKQI